MKKILDLINQNKWDIAIKSLPNIFAPITDSNNIFHFACMRGNNFIIDQISNLNSKFIYNINDSGNTGAHLLALNGFDELLINLVKKHPKFLKLRNNNDELVINLTLSRLSTTNKLLLIMNKNKLINHLNFTTSKNTTFITDVIDVTNDNKYISLLKTLNKYKIDFNLPKPEPSLIYAIKRDKLDIAKIITSFNININVITATQESPLILAMHTNNTELIGKIIKKKADVNFGGGENSNLPINIAIENKNYDVIRLLIKTNKLNLSKTDKELNIPIHYLLHTKPINNVPEDIMEYFIKNSNLNRKNIDKETPLKLLRKYKNLKKYIKKYTVSSESGYSDTTSSEHIIIPKTNNVKFGLFNSDVFHSALYLVYLLKKYNNLGMPLQYPTTEKYIFDLWKITNETTIHIDKKTDLFNNVINIQFKILFPFTSATIIWIDKDRNYIDKDIKYYIGRLINNKNVRFIMIKISIVPQATFTHANIALYDKKTNTLVRFEPYGDWKFFDSENLDNLLVNIFNSIGERKVQFLNPTKYLDTAKFQSLSNDTELMNARLGDPTGYCLAWCIWFVELRMSNQDVEYKELVENAMTEILDNNKSKENSIMLYIRNYSNLLDKEKNKLLKDVGFTDDEIYITAYTSEHFNKIVRYINDFAISNIKKLIK
jgi:ankyrin repeat protein